MLNFYTSFLARTAVFKGIAAQDIDKAIACLHGFYRSFEYAQEIYRSDTVISHAGIAAVPTKPTTPATPTAKATFAISFFISDLKYQHTSTRSF